MFTGGTIWILTHGQVPNVMGNVDAEASFVRRTHPPGPWLYKSPWTPMAAAASRPSWSGSRHCGCCRPVAPMQIHFSRKRTGTPARCKRKGEEDLESIRKNLSQGAGEAKGVGLGRETLTGPPGPVACPAKKPRHLFSDGTCGG